MSNLVTDSEDSSSSEDLANLREALDPTMFINQPVKNAINEPKQRLSYEDNLLNVTPEFQKFISTRLSKKLDEIIEIEERTFSTVECDNKSGIKLFSSSKYVMNKESFNEFEPIPAKKTRKKDKSNEVDDAVYESKLLKKAKSAAVSVDWILNKEGVREWCKPKGEEFVYKKNKKGQFELCA